MRNRFVRNLRDERFFTETRARGKKKKKKKKKKKTERNTKAPKQQQQQNAPYSHPECKNAFTAPPTAAGCCLLFRLDALWSRRSMSFFSLFSQRDDDDDEKSDSLSLSLDDDDDPTMETRARALLRDFIPFLLGGGGGGGGGETFPLSSNRNDTKKPFSIVLYIQKWCLKKRFQKTPAKKKSKVSRRRRRRREDQKKKLHFSTLNPSIC